MKFKLLPILFFTITLSLSAQTAIDGVVKVTKGLLLPQANVVIKGTQNGVITDLDGVLTPGTAQGRSANFQLSDVYFKAKEL